MALVSRSLDARNRSRWRLVVPALAVWLTLIALPAAALAAPTLTLTPAVAPRGAEVVITGDGYQPGTAVQLFVEAVPGQRDAPFAELTATADGTIRHSFVVPPAVPPGKVDFVTAAKADGQELARATFTVSDAPSVGPQLTIAPPSGPVGTRFTLSGSRFAPGAQLLYGINVNEQPVILGEITTGADGRFTASFDSSAIPPGDYELAIATSPTVQPLALARFAVTAATMPGLPNTGTGGLASWPTAPLTLLAGLGLAVALLTAAVARRRDAR